MLAEGVVSRDNICRYIVTLVARPELRIDDYSWLIDKSFNDVSATASIYAKISILQELIVHMRGEIAKLEKLREETDPLSGLKGSDKGG